MDNWLIFVVIIIGIVSSFLNKKTKEITKETPVYRQKEYMPAPSPVPQKTVTTYSTPRIEQSLPKYKSSSYNNSAISGEGISIEGKTLEYQSIDEENIEDNQNQKKLYSSRDVNKAINPNQVAQGIIWAEILGPPRSKKPHSPFRR